MVVAGHGKSVAFFITLGACIVALAFALNIGWIVLNWRTGLLLVLGVLFFVAIIAGVVLNTIFLVREVRRNEQHNSFINAVTHELKTPVASIRLYLQTLQSRELDDTKRQEFYRIMMEDSDRLLGTIEQVLRAGRTGAGKHGARALVDMGETVRECIEIARTRHHLDADAIGYSEVFPIGSGGNVMGDPEDLKAAVSNLIDNAIKYSTAPVRIQVEVASRDGRTVSVRVRDFGIGIPGPELKRVFKRFYRIPGTAAARVKGTGLGLFIVHSVAVRHGGRAYAESDGPGTGSTFTIQIPVAAES
ncbi:MAG: sensor histidine kinase [Bryobacteraceae bacterium]